MALLSKIHYKGLKLLNKNNDLIVRCCNNASAHILPLQWGAPVHGRRVSPQAALAEARPEATPRTPPSPRTGSSWRKLGSWGTGSMRGRHYRNAHSLSWVPLARVGGSAGMTASCTNSVLQPGKEVQRRRDKKHCNGKKNPQQQQKTHFHVYLLLLLLFKNINITEETHKSSSESPDKVG